MALFALAVVAVVGAINLVVVFLFGGGEDTAGLLVFTTLVTLAVIGGASMYRIASLRGGGETVALQFGGTPVPEETTDRYLQRLRNVVEEIAIASGVPMPGLYVLEHESAINAFAAGYSPSDAAIAVTRGALEKLNRDELQGVIAHEFSHILNGDMRLNIRLIGVLFGIMVMGIIGRRMVFHGSMSRNGRDSAAIFLVVALLAIVIGYVGLLFGRMIKAGISRTRESLADASAVQFTRQTAGLAGALKKIAGVYEGSRLGGNAQTEEISHMLFGEGMGFSGLFATHPPILERIRALEPGFRSEDLERLKAQWHSEPPNGLREDARMGLAGAHEVLPGAASKLIVTPAMVASQVAQPESDDYRRAGDIMHSIPDELRGLARQREQVMPLLLATLLDSEPAVLAKQRFEIASRLGNELADAAVGLRRTLAASLHPMQRLPLASLAFPVLRLRPRPQLDAFMDTVFAVVNADGKVSLFEYCLGRLLQVQVRESLDPARYSHFGRRKPGGVKAEFATLLAVVAQAGNPDDPAQAQRAYLAGMQRVLPRDHVPYAPPAAGVQALDAVWEPLDALDPLAKQVMVEAITAAASHDGRISVAEAELLRTICGALHCPLPPMLERA